MARLCGYLALLLAGAAASGGALIFWRPPTHGLELLALVASERSLFLAAGALLALALAVGAVLVRAPGPPVAVVLASVILAVGGVVLGVLPFSAARRVAAGTHLVLDIGRYLRARIDTEGPIRAERTVTYATTADGRTLGMDVYMPPSVPPTSPPSLVTPRPRPRPAVLVLHGGGWNAGDKGDASRFSRWLASQGFVVLDVEYRTHPQPNWRQAIGDVACAIVWVRRHAAEPEWNLDPGAITLLGRSAGGHLALLAAYGTDDTRLAPSLLPRLLPEGCRGTDTSVAAVIAYYAPTDLVWGHEHPASPRVYDSNDRMRRFIGGDGDAYQSLYQSLSPVNRVSGKSPRTLLIHGGRDQLVGAEHMFRLAAALARESVPHETLFLPTARHAFDFVVGGFDEQLASATVLRFLPRR